MIEDINWFFNNLKNNIPFCYVRFNDGEMMGIHRVGSIAARGDQVVDHSLQEALVSSITHKQENYYIGVPCSVCYPDYSKLSKELIGEYNQITSAVLLTNKNWKSFHDNLPIAAKDRDIVWVGGHDQEPERLKEYGLKIKKTLRVPNRESWNYYKKLKTIAPEHFCDGDVVCVSLGPTARVLCQQWYEEHPKVTFIDMGSLLDPIARDVWFDAHRGWNETGFNLVRRCPECN